MTRKEIPIFKSEEEEAEFWDSHSPLDFMTEPEIQKVEVRFLKDRIISIRLDSRNVLKLKKLAKEHNVGFSTLARLILMSALKTLRA